MTMMPPGEARLAVNLPAGSINQSASKLRRGIADYEKAIGFNTGVDGCGLQPEKPLRPGSTASKSQYDKGLGRR